AAAGLVLWILGRAPAPRTVESAWTVVAAHDATLTRAGATEELATGRRLPVGALVKVARGGEARLERATALGTARVRLAEDCEARVEDGALELLAGGVR